MVSYHFNLILQYRVLKKETVNTNGSAAFYFLSDITCIVIYATRVTGWHRSVSWCVNVVTFSGSGQFSVWTDCTPSWPGLPVCITWKSIIHKWCGCYLENCLNEMKMDENCFILIPKGNSYCRRKSSARGPRFKVSSEGLSAEIDIPLRSPIQVQTKSNAA